MIIHELLKNTSEEFCDKIAIIHSDKRISYKQLYERSLEISCKLKSQGVTKKTNVAIYIDNSIEFIECFFAINMCGATIIPIYTKTGVNKLNKTLEHYDISVVITTPKYKDMFEKEVKIECNNTKNVFYLEKNEIFRMDNEILLKVTEGTEQDTILTENDQALILFSSGTTNVSKGIILSNKNITSNVKAISDYLNVNSDDRILLIKNLNHASSITGEMLVSIYNGSTLILNSNIPTPSLILDMIQNYKISIFFAVPIILTSLLNYKNLNKYNLESLRIINFYGDSISTKIIDELIKKLSWVNFIYSYGLTEAAPRVTYAYKNELIKRVGTSGKAINGVEVFITDEDGKNIGRNKVGQITIKGPNIMIGYYKNKKLTDKVLRGGILHTSDLGYIDSDGFIYVSGRKDNLIVLAGKNIHPEEIEGVFKSITGIKEVLVQSEIDDLGRKILTAYIVLESDFSLKSRQILEYCKEELEDYKVPSKIVFVEELKKNANNKLIRSQRVK